MLLYKSGCCEGDADSSSNRPSLGSRSSFSDASVMSTRNHKREWKSHVSDPDKFLFLSPQPLWLPYLALWWSVAESATCAQLLTGPQASVQSMHTHLLTESLKAHIHHKQQPDGPSVTMTAPTCQNQYCCKPPGYPRAPPVMMTARTKTLVMMKWCYMTAR